MKKFFAMLFAIGFIFAIGLATTSDLETDTHKNMITDKQFAVQIAISLSLVSTGTIGFLVIANKQNNERVNCYGKLYQKKVSNHASVGNTYHTRADGTYVQSDSK